MSQEPELFPILRNPATQSVLAALSGLGMCGALYLIFLVVPDESTMGPVQRILYFHASAASSAYVLLAVLLVSSGVFLASRDESWDELSNATASVAFLLCSIVLFSGMIWGHSSWNTWWRWEPRLVSFLVLWLILGSYRVLRWFSGDHEKERTLASVMGILAAVNVPIVIFSVKVLAASEQLHPQVVTKGGLSDLPNAQLTLFFTMAVMLIFSCWLTILFYHQRFNERLLAHEEQNLWS